MPISSIGKFNALNTCVPRLEIKKLYLIDEYVKISANELPDQTSKNVLVNGTVRVCRRRSIVAAGPGYREHQDPRIGASTGFHRCSEPRHACHVQLTAEYANVALGAHLTLAVSIELELVRKAVHAAIVELFVPLVRSELLSAITG